LASIVTSSDATFDEDDIERLSFEQTTKYFAQVVHRYDMNLCLRGDMEIEYSATQLRTLVESVDNNFDPPLLVREIQRKLDEVIEQHHRELAAQTKKKRSPKKSLTYKI
jgi:hypothetical protein